nr:hypothetical protein [Pandoravirus massiliensis]
MMAHNLTLMDLPSEILCAVVASLDHPRDVAACACASRALACVPPLDAAASYYRGRSEMALADGLPLFVVVALFEQWDMAPEGRHLPAAARGGRTDVVRWVCHCVEERQTAWWHDYSTTGPTFDPNYAPAPDPQQQQQGETLGGCLDTRQRARTRTAECQGTRGPLGSTDNHGRVGPRGYMGIRGHYGASHPPGISGSTDDGDEGGDGDRDVPTSPDNARPAPTFAREWWNVPPARRHCGPTQGPPDSAGGPLKLLGDATDMPQLLQAIYESAQLGHVDVLRYLTTACPLAKTPCILDVRVVVEAARRGVLATVMYAHDRWPLYVPGACDGVTACCCPTAVAEAAVAGEQRHVLQWMRAVGCQAFACTTKQLSVAIRDGNDCMVDAITSMLADEARVVNQDVRSRVMGCVDEQALVHAAQKGHVRALAIAHTRGFVSLTANVLGAAAAAGKLNVLRWAAGETVPGVESRFAPPTRLPWDDRVVTWSAALWAGVDVTVLDWLLARPETRPHFDAVMARTMLVQNRPTVAFWMHDVGVVSLADWESLEAAIIAGVKCLNGMLDRGAACSPRAIAAALMHSHNADAIDLLCKRCGYDNLYEALRMHVHAVDNEAIHWVRDNVPGVDVTPIIEAAQAHALAGAPDRSAAGQQGVARRPSTVARVRLPRSSKPVD